MAQSKLKIKKGDTVVVLAGKDKKSKGEVLKVNPSDSTVIVQGINMMTKHNRPSQMAAGGIEKKEAPIHISNVALADPKSGDATRVGYQTLKTGKKVRIARKSGETIE